MAATVVSVVIFLCGVLVGRGVRGGQPDTAQVTTESADQQLQGAINPEKPPTVQQNEDPTKAPPPAPAEGGTTGDASLVADATPVVPAGAATGAARMPETPAAAPPPAAAANAASVAAAAKAADAKAAAAKAAGTGAAVKAVPPAARPEAAANRSPVRKDPAAAPASPAPGGESAPPAAVPTPDDTQRGWVVQVAATKTRSEAETIAKRLNGRGYSAFVLSNNANVFRVRVGGYRNKKDADGVAARLKKEERVTPWVTR